MMTNSPFMPGLARVERDNLRVTCGCLFNHGEQILQLLAHDLCSAYDRPDALRDDRHSSNGASLQLHWSDSPLAS